MRASAVLSIPLVAARLTSAFADPASSVTDLASLDTKPRFTATLGAGAGYLGGSEGSQGAAFRIGLGYRLTERLTLSFEGDYVSFARYSKDPSLSRQIGVMTLGLRYRPLGERSADDTLDLTNLQIRGGIGVAHEILTPYASLNPFKINQGPWAPAVAGSIAWLPLHGQAWEVGIELQASYARFDEPETSMSGMLVFNLDFGPSAPNPKKAPRQVAQR